MIKKLHLFYDDFINVVPSNIIIIGTIAQLLQTGSSHDSQNKFNYN